MRMGFGQYENYMQVGYQWSAGAEDKREMIYLEIDIFKTIALNDKMHQPFDMLSNGPLRGYIG